MFLVRFTLCAAAFLPIRGAFCQSAAPDPLPVREVTVFKDGHAFVLREGSAPVSAGGEVVLSDLPQPVVGTFWPYAVGSALRGVVAARQPVNNSRKTLSLAEMLRANIGAEITVIQANNSSFDATILDVPVAPPLDLASGIINEDQHRFLRSQEAAGGMILLQTKEGVRVRAIHSLGEIIFKSAPRTLLDVPEYRNLLRLQLETPVAGAKTANVGLVYLQKGLRWIPNYRLSLDGAGRAELKMQATLANELVDLKNANLNLVVGVPSFAFKDVIDPMALQATFTQLSPLFDANSRSAGAFANNIASQSYMFSNDLDVNTRRNSNGSTGAAIPGLEDGPGAGAEDFYLYNLKNITLQKGERMTFPLSSAPMTYEDIYRFETSAAPPIDVYRNLNYEQQTAANKLLSEPKVMHKIRLSNGSKAPLTTAPMLIESRGQLLAQTLMTYTATGGRSDIDLAPAVDVTVKRRETEVKRTPNAMQWQNNSYSRVDVAGRLTINSFRGAPITLELSQQWPGTVNSAGEKGEIRKLGLGDDNSGGAAPAWASYDYGNWLGLNGISTVNWRVKIAAKGKMEIPYTYHYFVR